MKALLCLLLACILITPLQAQVKGSGSNGLDSLKQSVKNLGKLFKKATIIQVNIANIKSDDPKLVNLVKQIRQVPGVTKLKERDALTDVSLEVGYKGSSTEFWSNVPAQAKKNFAALSITDSTIILASALETNKINATTKPSSTSPNPGVATTTEKPVTADKTMDPGNTSLTKGAAILFAKVKSQLSSSSKNLIFKMFNVGLTKDAKQFTTEGGEEYPFDAFVYPVDLNNDGKEEIFILFGNSYTSGMTGSSIVAYFPDKKGGFEVQLGFPGTLPEVLATGNQGFPDLLIGGPGFEFPVQRWNGKTYEFYRKVTDKDYEKLKKTNLEDLSKAYSGKIK